MWSFPSLEGSSPSLGTKNKNILNVKTMRLIVISLTGKTGSFDPFDNTNVMKSIVRSIDSQKEIDEKGESLEERFETSKNLKDGEGQQKIIEELMDLRNHANHVLAAQSMMLNVAALNVDFKMN